MATPLKLLILEDRLDDIHLLLRALRQEGFEPDWTNAMTEETYLEHLDESLDIILADYDLPQFNALEALHHLQEAGLDIPFIVVTASLEEAAIECMRHGADDYLLKDRLGRLGEAVRHALHGRKIQAEKREAEAALRDSAIRFRRLAENAPDVIYRFNYRPVPHLEYISPKVEEITGHRQEDFYEDPHLFRKLIAPDDREQLDSLLSQAPEGKPLVARLNHRNNHDVWVERRGTVTRDENGNVIAVEGIVRDVTARKQMEEALRASEAMYRGLVDASPDGIVQADLDGQILLANRHAADMLGYPMEALAQCTLRDFVAPADYPRLMKHRRRTVREGRVENVEFEIVRRDGTRFPAEVNASLVRDPAGEPTAIISILRDITARKKAAAVLQKRNDEIRSLYRAGTQLSQTLDLAVLSASTAEIVSGIMDCDTLILSRYDPDQELIYCVYIQHEGRAQDVSEFPPISLEPEGQGTQSQAIRTGESLLFTDYQAAIRDNRTKYYFDDEGNLVEVEDVENEDVTHSALIVPLKLGNQVRGVLQVFSQERDAYTLEHLAFLEALSPQIGSAMINALLHEQSQQELAERRRAEEAEREQRDLAEALVRTATALTKSLQLDEVAAQILDSVGSVVPHDAADILLVEDGVVHCIGHHGHEQFGSTQIIANLEFRVSETPVNKRMAETGRPSLLPDTKDEDEWVRFTGLEWIRSFVGTPIQLDGTLIGFISLTNATPNSFQQADAERLHAFAGQAAIAIRNARLYESERQQRTLAQALADTATLLNRTLDLDEVLERILDNVDRVVTSDGANISLIEDGIARVVGLKGRYADEGIVDQVLSLRFPVADIPNMQQMVETQAPLIIPDTNEYEGWRTSPATRWVRSYVASPIIQDGDVIGFLNLDSATPGDFSDVHAERLQLFADQVAVALRNARLFKAEQKRRENAETLRQASAALNATLAPEVVLERILEQISQVIAFDTASVQRRDGNELIISAVRGFPRPGDLLDQTIPINTGFPNARVVDYSEPYAVADITETHPGFMENAERLQATPIRSWLGIPLIANQRTIGVITLDRHEVNPFTDEDVTLAMTFANHAAIALQNARLHQALEHYSEFLEQAVTERTASLQEATEQVEVILRNSPDAVLLLQPDGTIETFNPALTALFGYKEYEVIDQRPSFIIAGRDKQAFERALRTAAEGERQRLNVVAEHKNASTFDADVILAPIKKDGQVVSVLCSLRDISKLKEVERMKDAFVSNVTHELRTPITSLKLYHGLLEMNPAKQEDYMDRLGREINRLNVIVEDLLRLSRMDQGRLSLELETVDLNALARTYVDDRMALAQQRGLTIAMELAPEPPPAHADEGMLGQVLSILLTNAVNYTPAGGRITVRTHPGREEEAEMVAVSVSDTGPGIQPEDLPHLFERFFRGKAGHNSGAPGTGLGLAIAHEIVTRHEGNIEIDTSTGIDSGTTFTVWLPVAGAQGVEIGD